MIKITKAIFDSINRELIYSESGNIKNLNETKLCQLHRMSDKKTYQTKGYLIIEEHKLDYQDFIGYQSVQIKYLWFEKEELQKALNRFKSCKKIIKKECK